MNADQPGEPKEKKTSWLGGHDDGPAAEKTSPDTADPGLTNFDPQHPLGQVLDFVRRLRHVISPPADAATIDLSASPRLDQWLDDFVRAWKERGQDLPLADLFRDFPEVLATLERQLRALQSGSLPAAPTAPGGMSTLGEYEVLEELGRGGMGVVYKARHLRLRRLVALKMLLASPHRSEEERVRFCTEAETIARLQHPNIVQIYEVGEQDGHPFLALEFVEGTTLDRELNGAPLAPRAAAQLLEQLARAIHAAHARGVVHRDLKPANVLLTPEGIPKITDFGLAKTLDQDGGQTRTGVVMGTPSYMAPEQARGASRDVTATTDVYALGAMLYETLTGRPPFQGSTNVETTRLVLEQEPVPPRRLQPQVPRDLQTICLTCLEKDPRKRYARALDLAEDLRRFQANEAIRARPAGITERTLKWVRRRPALAALGAVSVLAVVALLALWGFLTFQLRQERDNARSERQRAEANFEKAQQAVDQMLTKVAEETLIHEPRMEQKRRALLEDALAFYQEVLRERGDDARLQHKTALAYKRVADILRLLGRHDQAKAAYRDAIALLGPLVSARPDQPRFQFQLADSYNWYGDLERTTSRPDQARQAFLQARQLLESLVQTYPDRVLYRKDLARSHYNLGITHKEINQPREAQRAFRKAIGLLEDALPAAQAARLAGEHQSAIRQDLARSYLNLGPVLRRTGRHDKAKQAYCRAIRILDRLAQEHPGVPDYRYELGVACNNRGNFWADLPRNRPESSRALARADRDHRRALTLFDKLVSDYPAVPVYRQEQANSHNSLAGMLVQKKEYAAARDSWNRARAIQEKITEEFPRVADYQGDLGMTLGNLGWLLARQQKWAEARTLLEQAVGHVRAALRPNPQNPSYCLALRNQYRDLANAQLGLRDHAGAARSARALTRAHRQTKEDFLLAAYYLARCMALVKEDSHLPDEDRRALSVRYGELAISLLRQARQRGLDPRRLLKTNPAFGVLRSHPAFTEFLAEIQTPSAP
jgi:tetratricopeptide (TPR) repeat protein/tRNA A-37 threonylcarbamoyl transferase component Bud32